MQPIRAIFAGGGTGGHLFPGLAVAEAILRRQPGSRILFCATGKAWERSQVLRHGFEFCAVPSAPFIASPLGVLRAIYSTSVGYRTARRLIQTEAPHVVVGLGGYSSVPLCLAAAHFSIPLMLLEQNIVPGRANQWLSRWANLVCTMFSETDQYLSARPCVLTTGNPVRRAIVDRAHDRVSVAVQARDAHPLLLVLGGSQGAHSINRVFTEAWASISAHCDGWRVIHQTGARDYDWVSAAYKNYGDRVIATPFIDDMADVYAQATLAVARAGATTLAELAVCGVPAILLPYPFATANHQWHNAQAFGRAGAAIVVEDRREDGYSTSDLISAIVPLLKLPELRREMRFAMRELARPAAAATIASRIETFAADRAAVRRSA